MLWVTKALRRGRGGSTLWASSYQHAMMLIRTALWSCWQNLCATSERSALQLRRRAATEFVLRHIIAHPPMNWSTVGFGAVGVVTLSLVSRFTPEKLGTIYSVLSARIGSSRDALQAGTVQASAATEDKTKAASANVIQSRALVPYNIERIS
jgi:hypothetical protein